VLGPEHPDTATSLINVAQLRLAQSNVIGARLLLQRALRIRERTLGPRHPDTLTLRRHLGSLRGSGPRR
jgi:hypothetical protein